MKLGIISDTHDFLDDRVLEIFKGVDHIIHAGDVCQPTLIATLESVAPVTVALGNNDWHPAWRESVQMELGGRRFLVEHIVSPHAPKKPFQELLARAQPDVVVFGHTHHVFCETIQGVLFVNPGSAGHARFSLPRTVCLLSLDNGALHPEFIPLDDAACP